VVERFRVFRHVGFFRALSVLERVQHRRLFNKALGTFSRNKANLMHSSRWIVTLLAVALTVAVLAVSQNEAQSPPTRLAEDAPYPMVVRIDKSALSQIVNSEVDETRPVDKVVLGTHAVGRSRTLGTIRAALISDSTEASFDVRFLGKTTSTTVGTQEPAVIYSRTFTDFDCTRRVTFDPRKGFVVVGDVWIDGKTRLVFDGFAATKQFGRQLICRIAARRADQSHEEARLIADRDNKREVQDSFEKEVVRQVRVANEDQNLVRYVNHFLGDKTTLQLYAKSSPDCIHIGIGSEGEKYSPMTTLPPSRAKPAPIEIWVHSSILSEPVSALMKLSTPKTRVSIVEKSQILGSLSTLTSSPHSSVDVAIEDGWLVLGMLDDHAPISAPIEVPAVEPADVSNVNTTAK